MKLLRSDLSVWPSLGPLTTLQDELGRLFDNPLSELVRSSQLWNGWTPAFDIHEDKDRVIVKADLPGLKREDIDVSLHDGVLTVSGERKAAKETENTTVHRAERFFGTFQHSVALPAPVAADKIEALYKDGILTITLPKTEEAKPKRIDVKVN